MREIKFRAWDTDSDGYRHDGSVGFDGTIVSAWGHDKSHWILEQFTGLRDKNGQEIYEGDILRPCIRGAKTGVVFYDEDDPGYCIKKPNGVPYGMHSSFWRKSEVIGNIHENPELVR